MIGMIQHILDSSDILKVVISFAILLYLIALIIIHGKMKKRRKSAKIWNILCFVPVVFSAVHFAVFTWGSAFLYIMPSYICIYIPSVLMAIFPLLHKKKPLKFIGNVLCITISLVLLVLSVSTKVANYTRKSMRDAYISLCGYLEENYVLSEWKKADYEKLKADGLVLISEAEKTGNTDKYYEALYKLVDSFHDGHMSLSFYNTDYSYELENLMKFGDYGISLITLDNGDTIAVNIIEDIEIKDGDIITEWNGIPIDEAIDNVSLPVTTGTTLENVRIQKTFYLAGIGGDTAEVTYIGSDGTEATATLNRIDGNIPRAIKSFSLFTCSRNEEYDYRMLSDNIGYLRVTAEETNELSDTIAYITGNHTTAREIFREDLRELRNQGMTKLVIDIRNNEGGYEDIATALTSLFTKEQMYAFSLGVKNGKETECVIDRYVMPDGEFSNLKILVLTGMCCSSAGDGLTLYLSRLPNVTVAGLTNPSGINQETGGYVYMPENVVISFPVGLVLDEKGNPNIDVDYTQQSRNPVDIKIPLDKEAALKIFGGEDYELEWAIDYLNKN